MARYREEWFNARVDAAHLALLALDAAPDRSVGEMLKAKLLSQIGAHAVLARRGGARQVLSGAAPPMVDETFYLAEQGALDMIADSLAVFLTPEPRVIRVLAHSAADPSVIIELVLDEAPLRADMIAYGWRILALSVVISLVTATLVYLALHLLLVRPMRRITGSMTAFSEDPEDASRIITPSSRRDEVGVAERQLASMQRGLRAALTQRAHLAALGTAVAKINHDLKGILSSALLVSDRLEESEDPEVKRLTPTLVTAIERAVSLCGQTLDYVGRGEPEPLRRQIALANLVDDVRVALEASRDGAITVDNRISPDFQVVGDRDQLYRVFDNLVRNAADAGAANVTIDAEPGPDFAEIDISDDGPGLPERAKEKLFRPFEGSARAGGTGLGLAIARELAHAHGGELSLLSTGPGGTVFRLSLPVNA